MVLWLLPLLVSCSCLLSLKSTSGSAPGKMATIQQDPKCAPRGIRRIFLQFWWCWLLGCASSWQEVYVTRKEFYSLQQNLVEREKTPMRVSHGFCLIVSDQLSLIAGTARRGDTSSQGPLCYHWAEVCCGDLPWSLSSESGFVPWKNLNFSIIKDFVSPLSP